MRKGIKPDNYHLVEKYVHAPPGECTLCTWGVNVGSNQLKLNPENLACIHSSLQRTSVKVTQGVLMDIKLGADALEFMNVTQCLFQRNHEYHHKQKRPGL